MIGIPAHLSPILRILRSLAPESFVNDDARQAMGAGKIRVGVIGLGYWSEYGHLPSLKRLPDYELTAVYSRSPEKAAALVACHGFKYAASSLHELVSHRQAPSAFIQHADLVARQAPQPAFPYFIKEKSCLPILSF